MTVGNLEQLGLAIFFGTWTIYQLIHISSVHGAVSVLELIGAACVFVAAVLLLLGNVNIRRA